MKKIILFTAVAVAFSSALVSCKKDAASPPPPPPPVVIPVQPGSVAALVNGGTLLPLHTSATVEVGVAFKSSDNGNIKSLKLSSPVTGQTLITLWRSSDHSIVASRTFTTTHVNSWEDSLAVDIPIEANTEYILSMNSHDFNAISAPAGTFPFVNQSIILINYRDIAGVPQTFPTIVLTTAAVGLIDFTFQKASS